MPLSNTVGRLGDMLSPRIRAARTRPGGSNVGRYPHVKTFAGPSGGAPAGSYPINTLARAKSALNLAHNAPDPAGIRRAVYRKYPQLRPEGERRLQGREEAKARELRAQVRSQRAKRERAMNPRIPIAEQRAMEYR